MFLTTPLTRRSIRFSNAPAGSHFYKLFLKTKTRHPRRIGAFLSRFIAFAHYLDEPR